MTTATQNYSAFSPAEKAQKAQKAQKAPLTLAAVIASVLMLNLRESFDAATSGDKSDAAFAYGL